MASAIIHLAIAKELKKSLDIKNEKDYYLGTIAPDLSKLIKKSKTESHFLYNEKKDVPNTSMFTKKYPNYKQNDFDLGYYIHLYTDKLWFNKFLPSLIVSNSLKLLDGTIINTSQTAINNLIYSDYTNLNFQIIDEYNLDLSLFYKDFQKPNTEINEIPVDKLNILINQMGIIVENSTSNKRYIFDMNLIKKFIDQSTKEILKHIKKD